MTSSCNLDFEDFKRVFNFSSEYNLANTYSKDRTNGGPRGLGGIMDAFSRGKLTEIGIEKILYRINNKKKYILDFEIHPANEEPDIIKINDNGIREPNVFVEIKNTRDNDRWIGTTEEQLNTMCRAANNKKIYIIYASLITRPKEDRQRTDDLTGMFLKEIEDVKKTTIFQQYANINAEIKIEFIISSDDLKEKGLYFEKGQDMYETDVFKETKKSSVYSAGGKRKDISNSQTYTNHFQKMTINRTDNKNMSEKIRDFDINGSFIIHTKKKSSIIECIKDVKIKNNVFGSFDLFAGRFYGFNLKSIQELKRNNLLISKRRIYQLLETGELRNPEKVIEEIALEI